MADTFNDRIQIFDSSGSFISSFGSTDGGDDGQFRNPFGVAVDSDDRIIVADTDNARIQVFNMVSSSDGGGSGCRGDCIQPTLGIDTQGIRQVEDGFGYNNNHTDVQSFHTPYPLITTEVGQENSVTLRIYENYGPHSIELVQLGLGIPEIGAPLHSGEVVLEAWMKPNYSDVEQPPIVGEFVISDVHNLIENDSVWAETDLVPCMTSSVDYAGCLEMTLHYSYREAPLYNVMMINAMDAKRNAENTYFNDGVEVSGESLNPADVLNILPITTENYPQKRGMIELTQVDRAEKTWIDPYGYLWQGDTAKMVMISSIPFERFNDRISEHHGYNDRYNSHFGEYVLEQQRLAQDVFDEIVQHKQIQGDDLTGYVADTILYTITDRSDDVQLQNTMHSEDMRAQEKLAEIFEHMYPGRDFEN